MKIICPNCHSEYNVDKKEIPKNGRKIKCLTCRSVWVQYASGKIEKVKELSAFLDEIKIRQDSIKASLKKNAYEEKLSGKETKFPLNKEQERELLTALAIGEIQQNFQESKETLNRDSNIPKQFTESDEITDDLASNLELEGKQEVFAKKINRTVLGFILLSIVILTGLITYINRDLVMQIDPKYQKYLAGFLDTTDILIDQIQYHILALKDFIYLYFSS